MGLFLLGAAAVCAVGVDTETQEKDHCGGVGFWFGDRDDFGATAAEALLKAGACETAAIVAVEADAVEVGSEARVAGEHHMPVVGTTADWGLVLVDSIPVPDGEGCVACPGADSTEAEGAGEAIEVDDRVGAQGEEAHGFVEGAIHGESAASQREIGGVVDGAASRNQERTAVAHDHA